MKVKFKHQQLQLIKYAKEIIDQDPQTRARILKLTFKVPKTILIMQQN